MSTETKNSAATITVPVRTLAELLAGLQVPASIGGPEMLGEGYEPWRILFDRFNSFGWITADELEQRMLAEASS